MKSSTIAGLRILKSEAAGNEIAPRRVSRHTSVGWRDILPSRANKSLSVCSPFFFEYHTLSSENMQIWLKPCLTPSQGTIDDCFEGMNP